MSNIETNYHPEDWCEDKKDCEDQCGYETEMDDKDTCACAKIYDEKQNNKDKCDCEKKQLCNHDLPEIDEASQGTPVRYKISRWDCLED